MRESPGGEIRGLALRNRRLQLEEIVTSENEGTLKHVRGDRTSRKLRKDGNRREGERERERKGIVKRHVPATKKRTTKQREKRTSTSTDSTPHRPIYHRRNDYTYNVGH